MRSRPRLSRRSQLISHRLGALAGLDSAPDQRIRCTVRGLSTVTRKRGDDRGPDRTGRRDRSGGAARGDRSGGDHHRPAGGGAVLERRGAGPVRVDPGRGDRAENRRADRARGRAGHGRGHHGRGAGRDCRGRVGSRCAARTAPGSPPWSPTPGCTGTGSWSASSGCPPTSVRRCGRCWNGPPTRRWCSAPTGWSATPAPRCGSCSAGRTRTSSAPRSPPCCTRTTGARWAGSWRGSLADPGAHPPVELRVRRDEGWVWAEAALTNLLDDPTVRGVVCNLRHSLRRAAHEEAETRAATAADGAGHPGGHRTGQGVPRRPRSGSPWTWRRSGYTTRPGGIS